MLLCEICQHCVEMITLFYFTLRHWEGCVDERDGYFCKDAFEKILVHLHFVDVMGQKTDQLGNKIKILFFECFVGYAQIHHDGLDDGG